MKHLMGLVMVMAMSAPTVARADAEVAKEASDVVAKYYDRFHPGPANVTIFAKSPGVADCDAAIARARKAGVTHLTSWHFRDLGPENRIPIAEGAQMCRDFELHWLVGQHPVLRDAAFSVRELARGEYKSEEYLAQSAQEAEACTAAVKQIVAAGVPASFTFNLDNKPHIVGELQAKMCDVLANAATNHTKDREAAEAKRSEKYTKVGIAGDKLELMLHYDNKLVFLKGGKWSADLKPYARASVWFVWATTTTPDANQMVEHTIRKFTFKGNKTLKMTEAKYIRRSGQKLTGVFK